MVNYNQIIKQDMISIIINNYIQEDVLNFLGDGKNREKDFGIIKSKEEKKQLILSCIDSDSRDNLFQILTKELTHS